MNRLTRKQFCALQACDHALDHERAGHPVIATDFYPSFRSDPPGGAHPPRAAQASPSAALPSSALPGASYRLREPTLPDRYDDTGFAPDCVI